MITIFCKVQICCCTLTIVNKNWFFCQGLWMCDNFQRSDITILNSNHRTGHVKDLHLHCTGNWSSWRDKKYLELLSVSKNFHACIAELSNSYSCIVQIHKLKNFQLCCLTFKYFQLYPSITKTVNFQLCRLTFKYFQLHRSNTKT